MSNEIDDLIRPLNDYMRTVLQAGLQGEIDLPPLNTCERELMFELRARKLLKQDEETLKMSLTALGRTCAERLNYEAYSIEDKLTFAARVSNASKEICQLMDDAAQ